ncbi:MAG: 4-hydroxybutyryl-CoA dehydratase [Anaerolineales bacterium]|nr:4-hydroxybutyryl-CoA dehydratase [Anaerolineales bacterium]
MKTAEEYVESLKDLNREVYILGERVEDFVEHPILRPSLNALAMTYQLAWEPDHEELMVRQDGKGRKVNLFTSIHEGTDDLINKVQALRLLGQTTGTCFQRCVGWDALNTLSIVTYEMDAALSTDYQKRFLDYLSYVQEHDLVCNGAMTDVKGDRNRRPHEQEDLDLYLRVIERRDDGILVRGAKAHQTGSVFSHEIIVMPTLAMRAEEKDYAIAFAIPSDSPGVLHILGRQSSDTRKLEGVSIDLGNANFGAHEALVIFDDVFVPRERIFMDGEVEFSGRLVETFAAYHRQSYGGCKAGVGDVLIGAAASAAEFNGVARASHIRRKIAEMVHLNETLYSCGLACSLCGNAEASGTYLVDVLLANVCKQNVTRLPYEIARLAEDIAGGLMVTMPSEKDLRNPKVGHYIDKYLRASSTSSTEDRMRILRLIESMTMGTGAVAYRSESMHGAGSPEAQVIMIERQTDLEHKMSLAKDLAGIGR